MDQNWDESVKYDKILNIDNKQSSVNVLFLSQTKSHLVKKCSVLMVHSRCILPTCATANLGASLHTGDEAAGKATTDPFGNGKK
uniref:Uncharacterized protein n=1 Tax=Mastacembelus armatus TaxID=205130 RepID=A0A7N8X7Q3_9TELE